ncbi:Ig-like domain-containing protein [Anaerobacillus sp. HL2]|nr:Ig-like domain-containing protein [Anaerobacillus sp. HL2]
MSFNESLDHSTVNNNTVFVKNSFNRNVDINISLSTDGKKISVTPKQMYVPGYEYVLHIENVVSTQNERLSPAVKMPLLLRK